MPGLEPDRSTGQTCPSRVETISSANVALWPVGANVSWRVSAASIAKRSFKRSKRSKRPKLSRVAPKDRHVRSFQALQTCEGHAGGGAFRDIKEYLESP